MAVAIADVSAWWVDRWDDNPLYRGLGHVVAESSPGWVHTLCGTLSTGDVQSERPARVCEACVARLVVAKPVAGTDR